MVVTTRSGLGATNTAMATSPLPTADFGSVNGGVNLAFGGNKLGNFISVNGLNTSRFLDGPELRRCTITEMNRMFSTDWT